MKFLRLAGMFGSLFKVYSFFLLIPAIASLYWDAGVPDSTDLAGTEIPFKSTTLAFFLSFLVILLLGFALRALGGEATGELRERESYFIVGAGWIYCALLGAIPFILTRATLDPSIALFESMSGLTTTGFSALAVPLEKYPDSVHVWRATQHLFGGMGIVLVAVAVISKLTEGGARMMGGESGGDVERLQPKLTHTARSLAGIYLVINLISFVAFLVAIHFTGERLPWKTSVFESYVHSVAAVATGGFSTRTNSIAAFGSDAVSWVAIASMFLGGISFPLYFRAFRQGLGTFLGHPELRFYLLVIFLSFLGVAVFLLVQERSAGFVVREGLFYVITSLVTCGFTSSDPNGLPDGARLILVFLMFTGAMVGSTTGAIKLARIEILFRLVYYELVRLLHPRAVSIIRFAGRTIPEAAQRRVIVFFFSYVTVAIGGMLFLTFFGLDFESSIVTSAATLGGVGYGWGGAAVVYSGADAVHTRIVGILLMWMGRLEIFTAVLLFIPATYRD